MAYVEIDIHKEYSRKLYRSLCIASASSSYSLCIEYMKKWFLSKFNDDFFKSIYVDGRHIMDESRKLSELQKLKRLKPSLAIIPNIDLNFDNEKIDSHPYGLEIYTTKGKFSDAFFNDTINDVYLGIGLEVNLLNFAFKVRLSTRSQQIDIHKYMKTAFRIGYTQGEYIDMDFHVPYSLMIQMAKDLGFEVVDDKIQNISEFISYLNKNSLLPFTYKFRCVNGKNEFFIRMSDIYIHIATPDINSDDGEQEGQLMTNFVIDMNATVRFPSPHYYSYYSKSYHEDIISGSPYYDSNSSNSFVAKLPNIPKINSNQWPQYITTEYEDNDLDIPLSIDFADLFEGDLKKIIDYTKYMNISPSIFMDINIYNNGDLIESTMDWNTLILTTNDKVINPISFIVLYCDLEYINNTLKIINPEIKTTRIN